MLRIRLRKVLMMACGIAGAMSLACSAWGDPLVELETSPVYLSSVAIGSAGGIDLANTTDGTNFGGLIVPDASGMPGTPVGFAYLNPNGGAAEYGQLAIADAIRAGGNYTTPSTATLEGISSTNAQGIQNAVVGYFDNNANGTPYYSSSRGVDLTAAGPTGGTPVTLISPTYIADATLQGSVNLGDFGDWLAGYLAGDSGWQNGDYVDDGKVELDSFGAWLAVYLAIPNQQYPGFVAPAYAGPVQLSGGPVAVPEPAISGLLLAAAAAAVAFRWRSAR